MSKLISKHAHFSSIKENDKSITVGSPAFDRLHRSRLEYDRLQLLEQALRSYRLNPMSRRIVKLYRYFALGSNVEVEVKGKPSNFFKRMFAYDKLERTQRFVFQFWNHPVNKMDDQISEWFDERTLTGELYILFSSDESGMTLVRAIPSETISKIDTAENDYRQETVYHTGEIDDKAYPAYSGSAIAESGAVIKPFVRHYVINRPVGSTWGESDLFPLLPWIARYTGWLENRATLNYWRQIFVWSVKGKYASAEEREARQKEIEAHTTQVDMIDFKITDVTAEVTIPYSAAYLDKSAFALERGVWVSGAPVTIRTVYYNIMSMLAGPLGITLRGHILLNYHVSIDGCIWYMDIIDQIIGPTGGYAWDTTVTYENPAAPWLSYLFYPLGRYLTLGNMQSIFNVLAQKYLIFAGENINGLCMFQATAAKVKDYDIVDELLTHEILTLPRRLMWRDEAMTIHYSGVSSNPIHNLGYIDSLQGAAPTNTASPKPFKSSKLPVHLKYRTGDVVKLGTASNYYQGRIKVTEVFDPKSNPSWHVIIEPLCWFANTEGGALPSTIEAAAPYTPLHTGYFTKTLSSADNNIQAAMETIDDHEHATLYAPLAKGVTNGDTHDYSGGDGAQINHTTLSNIGTNTHAAIDTFIATKAAANGLASLGANVAVPESQLAHKVDWPGVPNYAVDEHFFAAPAWTGWVNQPGAAGYAIVSGHYGHYMNDDTNLFSLYYRNVTPAGTGENVFMECINGYTNEVGIHLDDGTLNNYYQIGLVYVSAGISKIVKRICVAGVITATDLVTNMPWTIYGLRMYLNAAAAIYPYYFKDVAMSIGIAGGSASWFTYARLGFYFSKTGTGGTRDAYFLRWTDSL